MRTRFLLVLLAIALAGCDGSATKGINKEKDVPKPAAAK